MFTSTHYLKTEADYMNYNHLINSKSNTSDQSNSDLNGGGFSHQNFKTAQTP
jgi:hypothetical protein